ncbi:inner membrane complex [Labeo rohita]|uniref:Inner membrane complex n=1 Tax=Labeo rohita TaxID=84645 RepID=A0A498M3E0_LABRO|nr:inner membrane complex [Labeo rohita]
MVSELDREEVALPQLQPSESLVELPQLQPSESLMELPQLQPPESLVELPQLQPPESLMELPQLQPPESLMELPQLQPPESLVGLPQPAEECFQLLEGMENTFSTQGTGNLLDLLLQDETIYSVDTDVSTLDLSEFLDS